MKSWIYSAVALLVLLLIICVSYVIKSQETKSWFTTLVLSESGESSIREIIDTDFSSTDQRGIWREIPNVKSIDFVYSPYAPDTSKILSNPEIATFPGCSINYQDMTACLRIGKPEVNNYGLHRYIIDYQLQDDKLLSSNECGLRTDAENGVNTFCWIGVPEGWNWNIKSAMLQIKSEKQLINPECSVGYWYPSNFSSQSNNCEIRQIGDITIVTANNIDRSTGVWVRAKVSNQDASPDESFLNPPKAPSRDDARHPISKDFLFILIALIIAVLGKILTTQFLLYKGRDIVRDGGATEAAFADSNEGSTKALSNKEMEKLVTLSVVPPDNVTPYHGAIIVNEKVTADAKQAWFLSQILDKRIEMRGKSGTKFKYASSEPPEIDGPLEKMFGRKAHEHKPLIDLKDPVPLDGPQQRSRESFALGWDVLDKRLKEWFEESDSWLHRKPFNWKYAVVILSGTLLGIGGVVVALPKIGYILGSFLFGALVAYQFRSYELAVRSPKGSGQWIQIQGFKKFIQTSEAKHVERAAKDGKLRLYTAWAVALGEIDHWSKTLKASKIMEEPDYVDDWVFTSHAYLFHSYSTENYDTESNFGGGGGGGGGDGGGGGGGGGGGW